MSSGTSHHKTFSVGTRIVVGKGATADLGGLLESFGQRRWALIADCGVAEAGLLEQVFASADTATIGTTCLVGVNPGLAETARFAEDSAAAGCDGVLALGGGSALCAAKAVAILLTNPGPIDRYEGVGKVPALPAPTVAIPTTAGSGSEVSNALVLHEAGHACEVVVRGPGYEPALAVLDGMLLRTLPARPMIEAALDALTHALEARWVRGRTFFTDALAATAAAELCASLPRALEQRDDDSLQSLLEASCAANLACGNSGLGLVHALTTSPQVHLAHGYQNGALLLHVAAYNEAFLDAATRKLVVAAAGLYEAIGWKAGFESSDTTPAERDAFLIAADGHAFRVNNARPSSDEDLHAILDQAGVAPASA